MTGHEYLIVAQLNDVRNAQSILQGFVGVDGVVEEWEVAAISHTLRNIETRLLRAMPEITEDSPTCFLSDEEYEQVMKPLNDLKAQREGRQARK